jgi:hypothetical protein
LGQILGLLLTYQNAVWHAVKAMDSSDWETRVDMVGNTHRLVSLGRPYRYRKNTKVAETVSFLVSQKTLAGRDDAFEEESKRRAAGLDELTLFVADYSVVDLTMSCAVALVAEMRKTVAALASATVADLGVEALHREKFPVELRRQLGVKTILYNL